MIELKTDNFLSLVSLIYSLKREYSMV